VSQCCRFFAGTLLEKSLVLPVSAADTPGVRVVPGWGVRQLCGLTWTPRRRGSSMLGDPLSHRAWRPLTFGDYLGSGINKSDPSVTTDDVIKGFLQVRRLQTRVAGNLPNQTCPWAIPLPPFSGYRQYVNHVHGYGSAPLAHFAASSADWGLALHAYEGGPDTSGGTPAATLMALANACKDSRMTAVVTGIASNRQSWGAGMFNFFIISAQPL